VAAALGGRRPTSSVNVLAASRLLDHPRTGYPREPTYCPPGRLAHSASPESSSDGVEPVQHSLWQGQVGTVAGLGRPIDHDQVLVGHVTDQDADHAKGRGSWAETSAMDRRSWQRAAMARCSTVSFGVGSPTEVVKTSVSISRAVWVGRVRPPVMA
jgi:hypothetical protein